MLRLSAEYSVSICVLITTSPTIYFSIKMRSMAETYGHLLPLVRTTCLRRPVVSATVCFVTTYHSARSVHCEFVTSQRARNLLAAFE